MTEKITQIKGRPVVRGKSYSSYGPVMEAWTSREADEENEVNEGVVLVLRDGDLAIPEEIVDRVVAVAIEPDERNSRMARICAQHKIPCVVNLPGLCDWVRRGEYLRVNSANGVVQKYNPGMFGKSTSYRKPKQAKDPEQVEGEQSADQKENPEQPKKKSIWSIISGR